MVAGVGSGPMLAELTLCVALARGYWLAQDYEAELIARNKFANWCSDITPDERDDILDDLIIYPFIHQTEIV